MSHIPLERFAIVVSMGSRTGESTLAGLKSTFGSKVDFLVGADSPRTMRHLVTEACKEHDYILVAGGDGSVRQASAIISRKGKTLGIIPSGTGNALAHELGIPLSSVAAVEFLADEAVSSEIDIGFVNAEPFLTVATLGLTSEIGKVLRTLPKRILGRLAYLPALVRAYSVVEPFSAEIEVENAVWSGEFLQVAVSASRNQGVTVPTTPEALGNDGRLSVYALKGTRKQDLFAYGLRLLTGTHTQAKNVLTAESPSVIINVSKTQRMSIDGDPITSGLFNFEIRKRALRVLRAS